MSIGSARPPPRARALAPAVFLVAVPRLEHATAFAAQVVAVRGPALLPYPRIVDRDAAGVFAVPLVAADRDELRTAARVCAGDGLPALKRGEATSLVPLLVVLRRSPVSQCVLPPP